MKWRAAQGHAARGDTLGRLRSRLPVALVAAAAAAVVTVALTGAADPGRGLSFSLSGHWTSNAALGLIVHVNGANKKVDQQVAIPGLEPGTPVVQGDTSGYVIGRSQVVEFGKSDLAVTKTLTPPVTGERPVFLETTGGPYLVYREAGSVVRLGDTMTVVPAGGRLGEPVAAKSGTIWLQRLDTGSLCELSKDADRLACPALTPAGHSGALTLVGDKPVFVDTSSGTLSLVGSSGLEAAVPLGVDVSAGSQVAGADAQGRIAILDPATNHLHLVDTGGLTKDRPTVPPVTVDLPAGDYATPATTGSSVVVLDKHNRSLRTYTSDGISRGVTQIPVEQGEPRMSKGDDDRVYIDGDEGKHVVVVDPDGTVGDVAVTADPPQDKPSEPVQQAAQQQPVSTGPPAGNTPARTPKRSSTPTRVVPPAAPPVKASPATRPGIPAGLTATLTGAGARLNWGAATPNGAPVTAYHVSWARDDGSGAGSTDTSGTAGTATIPSLVAGATYRVQVVAENSAGRGAAATSTVTRPAPTPTITLSQGSRPTGEYHNCGLDEDTPSCGWMNVVLTNFSPNTTYQVKSHASADYDSRVVSVKTNKDGYATLTDFYYYAVGNQVWVTVGNVSSSKITWKAAQ